MKKSGFTLAEVLIAMGIIGVVAAMILPTFVMNGRQQANDAKFSSSIADLENAFGTMITKEVVDGFSETKFGKDKTAKEIATDGNEDYVLKSYIKTSGDGTTIASMYSSTTSFKDKGCKDALTITPTIIFGLKNGSYYIVTDGNGNGYIDVNGSSKPNCLNRDLYKVSLDENGLFTRENENTTSNAGTEGEGEDSE